MSDSKAVNELIVAELGRATAECLRIRARLHAITAEPPNTHFLEEREQLEALLRLTEERRKQLEQLVAGMSRAP